MERNENVKITDKMSFGLDKRIKDELSMKTNLKIELWDADGHLKEVREVHNTTTSAALAGLMDQILASPTLAKPGWIELGTGSPAATLLGAYIVGSRVAVTTKTRVTNVVTLVGDWGAGVGTGSITEAGIFDVVTANTVNMWCSASFGVVTKGVNDVLKLTWTLTQN
jgi:hypothetical protein